MLYCNNNNNNSNNNNDSKEEKISKYQNLKYEMATLWKMKKVEVIPIIVGALGAVLCNIKDWFN